MGPTFRWFRSILHWSFRKYWFAEFCMASRCPLLYKREKRRHLLALPISSRKSKCGKAVKLIVADKGLPKFKFFFKDIILLLEKSAVRWFPWSDWLTFYALEKIPAKSQVSITVFCHFFHRVLWIQGASSASDSITGILCLRQWSPLVRRGSILCILLFCHTGMYSRAEM